MVGNRGLSTLEVLLAFTILTLAMTTIILVVFGNQSVAIQTQNMHQALYLARGAVDPYAYEFDELVSESLQLNNVINGERIVRNMTGCVKEVTGEVSWSDSAEPLRLSRLVVGLDLITDRGGDCDVVPFTNSFHALDSVASSLTTSGFSLGEARAMDLHIVEGEPYIAFGGTWGTDGARSDVWLVDASDIDDLVVTDAVPPGNTLGDVTALDFITGHIFAAGSDAASGTVQIFNIPTESGSMLAQNWLQLPVDVRGEDGEVNTLLYDDGALYVGLDDVAGAEFWVIDATNPGNLATSTSFEMGGHNIHDMVIRDGYIFAATSDDDYEITVIDATVPSNASTSYALSFDLPGDHDANKLALIGNTLYVGRKGNNAEGMDEVYQLEIASRPPVLSIQSSYDLGSNFNGDQDRVTSLVAKENVLFVATSEGSSTHEIRVLRSADGVLIEASECSSSYSSLEGYEALDTMGDYIIAADEESGVRIFTNDDTVCEA